MMRALVDIDETQIRALDQLARKHRRSRAALIRDAVSEYLRQRPPAALDEAFGLWGDRKVDGLNYQEDLRSEW